MSAAQYIGIGMLAALFLLAFSIGARIDGFWATVKIFATITGLVIFGSIAIALIGTPP